MLPAVLAAGFSFVAHATTYPPGDPVSGYQLYNVTPGGWLSCATATCHGTDPTKNQNHVLLGANDPAAIQTAIDNNDGEMDHYAGVFSTQDLSDMAAYLGNPPAGQGPDAKLSPTSVTFSSTAVGSTSSASTVTLTNTGTKTLTIGTITVSRSDFQVSGGTCAAGGNVAAAAKCTVLVVFSPQSTGSISGSLNITHNAANSPSTVLLSGSATGSPAVISVAPTSLAFGSQPLGVASASQTVTVTNTGSGKLTFSDFTLGGSNSGDFKINGGTCALNTPVNAGGTCTIDIQFTPAAQGALSATMTISSNASNGLGVVNLSGTGTGSPIATVTPSSLAFGSVAVGHNSPVQVVTVRNSGTQVLSISDVSVSSGPFVIAGGTCHAGSVVAPSTACTISMQFDPTVISDASSTLSITHNATGSPSTVAMTGTGTAETPNAVVSPTTLSFSSVLKRTSNTEYVTLSNTGTADLVASDISLGGTNPKEYAITGDGTCAVGTAVKPSQSCTVGIQFTPASRGTQPAQLSISHNDTAHSPSLVALAGLGTTTPQGQISVDQAALNFAAQSSGTTSSAQTVTVTDTGASNFTITTLTLAGTSPGEFKISGGTCAVNGTVKSGQSCTVQVVFAPTVAFGTESAQLTITGSNSAGTAYITLTGIAAPPNAPLVALSPSTLDLGGGLTGVATQPQQVILANSGSADMTISSIVAAPADQFAQTNDCGTTLPASGYCTLSITFTATQVGAVTGTVTVTTNAASSPDAVALSATGVPPNAPQLEWVPSAALNFDTTAVGQQAGPLSLTLSNTGTAPAQVTQFAISGDAQTDFSVDPSTTCEPSGTIEVGATCQIAVVFAPSAMGTRSASLNVVSNAAGLTPASLNGTGSAPVYPTMKLSPQNMTLYPNSSNQLQAQTLVVKNVGAGTLNVSAVAVSGQVMVMDASTNSSATCSAPPFQVASGTSCTLLVGATASGAITGTVTVTSNDTSANDTVNVSGQPMTNVGAGGCSLGRPGQPKDPIWAVMLFGAVGAMLWRRRRLAHLRQSI